MTVSKEATKAATSSADILESSRHGILERAIFKEIFETLVMGENVLSAAAG